MRSELGGRRLPVLFFGLLVLAVGMRAAGVRADEPAYTSHNFRAALGLGRLLGEPQASDFRIGFGFGAGYEYRFAPALGVGVDYMGHLFPVRAPGVSGVGTLHTVGPSLLLHPLPRVALGDLRFDVGPDLAVTGGSVRFGFHAGAAFDFKLSTHVLAGPYVRYRHAISPNLADPKALTFGVELSLGFGGSEALEEEEPVVLAPPAPLDTDSDGVEDALDACPNLAGVPDGSAGNGCPEPTDADGDGVLDAEDRCPAEPETANGLDDGDGCPDVIAETVEPVPDSVGEEAESTPTPRPARERPAPPVRAPRRTGVPNTPPVASLHCEVGSADVHARHGADLDELVRTLTEQPDLHIVVVGHADPTGTDAYNNALSRRRAFALRDDLVERGIDSRRIRVLWFGERRPVDPGSDDAALEHNRRVEVFMEGE